MARASRLTNKQQQYHKKKQHKRCIRNEIIYVDMVIDDAIHNL